MRQPRMQSCCASAMGQSNFARSLTDGLLWVCEAAVYKPNAEIMIHDGANASQQMWPSNISGIHG